MQDIDSYCDAQWSHERCTETMAPSKGNRALMAVSSFSCLLPLLAMAMVPIVISQNDYNSSLSANFSDSAFNFSDSAYNFSDSALNFNDSAFNSSDSAFNSSDSAFNFNDSAFNYSDSASYNLRLAPGQKKILLAWPGTRNKLSVDVMWDEEGVSVLAFLDRSRVIYSDFFTSATNGTPGIAKFTSIRPRWKWTEKTYTLDVTAFKPSGEAVTLRVIIYGQDPVSEIKFKDFMMLPGSTAIPLPDGTVTMAVHVINKNLYAQALCYWDSGMVDGIFDEFKIIIPSDFPIYQSFSYNSTDNYTVEFHCRNLMSPDVQLTSIIEVLRWQMSDFKMDIADFQLMDGTIPKADFQLHMTLNTIKRPPRGLYASFVYGDGSPVDTFVFRTLKHTHRYPRRGVYEGSVFLSHPDFGNTTLNFTARVGAFQLSVEGTGGLVDIKTFTFTVEAPSTFYGYVSIRTGSTVIYQSGNPVSIVNHQVQHVFSEIGFHAVFFQAKTLSHDHGGNVTETGEMADPLLVEGIVDSSLTLTVSPASVLTPSGEVTATILLDRTVHDIDPLHCSFDFQEEQDPELRNWTGTLRTQSSFDVQFAYMTLGSHVINVDCYNNYSAHSLTFFVFAYHPCVSDDPIFDWQYRIHNPMVVLNSVDFRLVTRTIIYCSGPSFWWWIQELTPDGVRERKDLEQLNLDYMDFERGSLEPGLYRMKLNISFGPENNNTWLQGGTYVRIVRAPLVAEIVGGSVRLTGDRHAIVDGYSLSYEPLYGIDNKDGLQFAWQCMTLNTADFDELVAVSSQPLPPDIDTDCDEISTEILPGRRQLKVGGGVTAVGYVFKMSVKKGNDISEPATLFLQYSRVSFAIELICVLNCEKKTAVTSPASFSVECSTCSDSDLLDAGYAWSLSLYNNDTGEFDLVPDHQSYFSQSGIDKGPSVVIRENSLEPCSYYQVMVRMTSPSGRSAAAGREFLTNCPPWGGNCSVVPQEGDVVTQRFTLNCADWKDDGFDPPTNSTDEDEDIEDDGDKKKASSSLYYKFMLRKNGITVPIAEGGESTMPRVQMPMIVGHGGGYYQLIARIYDVLQDYTEVATEIYLNTSQADESITLSGKNIEFWKNQINYTDKSSTLNKQLRGMSTASALLAMAPLPEVRSAFDVPADTSNDSAVVSEDWDNLWYVLNNPPSNPAKDQLTELTEQFTNMVHARDRELSSLTGQGISALGEGLVSVLANAKTTDESTVLTSSDIAEKGSMSLKRLINTKPFPIGARLTESVFSMTGLIDKILASSLPSYDLSIGVGLVFNSSDVGEDESIFMTSRLKIAQYTRDKKKIDTTRAAMPKLTQAVDTMLDTLLSGMVLGQPQVQVKRDGIALAVNKMTGRGLRKATVSAGTLDLQLVPDDDDNADAPMEVKTTVFNKNPFAWSKDGSSYEITSPVLTVNLTDKRGSRQLRKLTMRLKRGETIPVPSPEPYSTEQTRSGPDGWLFHRLTLRSGSSAVVTRFQMPAGMSRVEAYFRTGRAPTRSRYDVRTGGQLVKSRKRRQATGNITVDTSSGFEYGGLYQFFVPPGSLSPGIVFVGFHLPELSPNDTREYRFLSFSDMCRVWDEVTETWDPSACTVSKISSPQETVCICDDPPGTSFASSFFVAPNIIDFSTVFLKFDASNASVYGTLIGLLLLWILALVWARRKDNKDRHRWMVGYLVDNHVRDDRFYLMTVYTGLRRGAGTRSNVSFILMGDKGNSRVRMLSDGERTLSTGSVLPYILSTSSDLGHLEVLRLWHDDSAEGEHASWYLSRVVLEDLQTGEIYNFICERWFAWDKDDGMIDRAVPVALEEEVKAFEKLFQEHARVGITDSHLWLSCLQRPERSTFTRVQRVSCCVALLLLTMMTSALFYQPEDNETGESTNRLGMEVNIGPLRFSMTTLWTSTASIVITTIPLFIFVYFFRSYRPMRGPRVTANSLSMSETFSPTQSPKKLPMTPEKDPDATNKLKCESQAKEEEVEKNCEENEHDEENLEEGTTEACENCEMKEGREKGREDRSELEDNTVNATARNLSGLLDNTLQRNPLPQFFVYITWVMLVGTMATCAFFLILYSMQWGSTTSEEWLASFFASFAESFFLFEPLKVLILACLLAYCAGNPFSSSQHQFVDIHRVQEEARTFGSETIDREAKPPKPVSGRDLKKARKRRQDEQLAHSVFFELIFYFIFVISVFSVSYGNRDQRAYRTKHHLDNLLYSASGDAPFPFESISSREDVMRYMNETLMNSAFPWTDITGNELPWRQRLFASDGVSFRVGPVRVRQVRMPHLAPPKVSRLYPPLQSSGDVYPPYNSEQEERGSYCLGWRPTPCPYEELSTKLSLAAWSYVADVLPVPVWGTYAFYSSGGYIADLTVNRDVVSRTIEELNEERWLDLQTRAVFVELCLYNPNTNLFTFLRMGAEFPETGGNNVWRDLKTLRLYQHLGALGAYVFVCELLAMLFVLVFTVKAVLKVKAQKCAYFTDFWQVLDLMSLLVAYVAVAFYVIKTLSINEVMALWRHDPKVYVDFFLPVMWDAIYGYILAGLVFVVSIRLLRVLGYNQRVTMLATVLSRSGPALVGYSLVFFIILSAYVWAGHVMFVTSMEQFRTIWDTYSTLYIVLLGTSRIGRWIRTSPLWAQAYFISLTFLVLFILYTMFQAILCDMTVEVQHDVRNMPTPYGVTNVISKMLRALTTDWIPTRFFRGNKTESPVVSDPDPQLTATTGDVNADVAEKMEGSESAAMAKTQTVPKKPLSSHRPDDEVPGAAAILENLEADMMELKQEMQERLRREQEKKAQMDLERRRRAKGSKDVHLVVPEEQKDEPGVLSMTTLSNIALSFQLWDERPQ